MAALSEKMVACDTFIDGQKATRLMLVTASVKAKGTALVVIGKRNAMVSGLFVAARHRRKGVAGRLIAECGRIARRNKCETLSLIVVEKNNAARAAYTTMGFFTTYHFEDGDDLMTIRL